MIPDDIMQLCRLCLVGERVKIAIFEDQDRDDIFSKIRTCLPITILKDDNLPQNICVDCSLKLQSYYQFRCDTLKAEKQLNLWLSVSNINNDLIYDFRSTYKSMIKDPINNKHINVTEVKQENVDSDDDLLINKLKSNEDFMKENEKTERNAELVTQIIQSHQISVNEESAKSDDESEDEKNFIANSSPLSTEDTCQNEDTSLENPQHSTHLVPIVELSEGTWWHNEDITNPFAAEIHSTLKKMGYKNPFVYPELKHKKKSMKKLESKNNTKWQCMICSDVKVNKSDLIEHYEIHKRETESIKGSKIIGDYFMCPVCLTDFTSLISYEKHVELNHGEKQYNCEVCHRAFKNLYSLSVHNHKRHRGDKIFKCAGCDFEDHQLKELRIHIRTEHEQHVKYHCEICNKGFSSLSWYQEHKNFHTGAMPFECEVCSKSFPYTRYLIAHKKKMHSELFSSVPINHECEICHKKFAHKKSLVLHLRGHTGESAVLCDMCGKSLSSSEHLKQHLRIHTGYKPHCCSVCGKGFAKKCNLTLHERVHSGEKPHICNVCGKGFSQRSTLVIHGRYHSGERPYRCQLCQKGFVAKGLLGVHMKTCIGIPD